MEQLLEKIKGLLRTFPLLGFTGKKTFRVVDEDVFLIALEQILEEYKRTENPA